MDDLQPLCNSGDLAEAGQAVPFDVVYAGQTCRAFAVRFKGSVHAYLNRCTHVAMELDWQPNRVFDASRTADKTAGKPDPQMLHELMTELGTTKQRTLMVGDTTHDLQMAVNADCPSLGVSYGAHEPSAFAALKPLHIAHSVQDMHEWLLKNG